MLKKENKIIILILTIICVIWLFIGIYHLIIKQSINTYIADVLLNSLSLFYIYKIIKDNNFIGNIKLKFSLFFLFNGVFFLLWNCVTLILNNNIESFDTFYFFSDFLMIILSLLLCDKDICIKIQKFFK